jgi:hypothetical protein
MEMKQVFSSDSDDDDESSSSSTSSKEDSELDLPEVMTYLKNINNK